MRDMDERAAMSQSFVRLHSAWASDGELAELMTEGRHDAVCLFFAAIAHSYAHDTDGTLSEADIHSLMLSISARSDALEALITARKVERLRGNSARKKYRIRAYARWQGTVDQRKDNAERMRQARARSSVPASQPEKPASQHARANGVHAPAPDDGGGSTCLTCRADAAAEAERFDDIRDRPRWVTKRAARLHGDGNCQTQVARDGAPREPRRLYDVIEADELLAQASRRITEVETGGAV